MTQEEKNLLLRDLCGRLPYEVVALKTYKEGSKTMESTSLIETDDIDMLLGTVEDMEEAHYTIKPYLRPLSSMTEKEYNSMSWEGCNHVINYSVKHGFRFVEITSFTIEILNWLNANHFDYRGLIEKGLALEAPEDIYKTE